MTVHEIDGKNFQSLEDFFAEFRRQVTPLWDYPFHGLDGFNDVLRGGFGSPDEDFTLRWKHHLLSKSRLGYPETVRQLEKRLASCHPSNRTRVSRELELARAKKGPTVFDWLVEIIHEHEADGITLMLE